MSIGQEPATSDILDRESFSRLAEPYRPILKLHCYRMLGSMYEAEDVVQETFIRAWSALDGFERRASLKNWLFRIATNVCLNALNSRSRRRSVLPEQLGEPSTEMPSGEPESEVRWLQPYPDFELDGIADQSPGPDVRYEMREAVRLAFVAAVQRLPPRQRAVLILTDVMGWPSDEVASLLGGSVASINSALQRARETMRKHYEGATPQHRPSEDSSQKQLVDRYVRAWESVDLDGFIGLLKEDATYAMPPWRHWYMGRDSIKSFFAKVWPAYHGFRLLPIAANAQPAFALYTLAKEDGTWRAHSLQVLTMRDEGIAGLTAFVKPLGPTLFSGFRLPHILQIVPGTDEISRD